ncbi:MAG: hypothetical protein ACYCWE_21300 [Eubacteriales bacterium]
MEILSFLLMNWSSVLLVIALFAVLVILYIRGETRLINYILYLGITEAEKQYGSKTGQLKKAAVITKIYTSIPVILKIIITETRLSQLIDKALAYAKKTWAENAAIGTYATGDEVEEKEQAEANETVPP